MASGMFLLHWRKYLSNIFMKSLMKIVFAYLNRRDVRRCTIEKESALLSLI